MTSQKRNGNSLYFYFINLKDSQSHWQGSSLVARGAQIVKLRNIARKNYHWEPENGRMETPFFWRLPKRHLNK